MIGVAGLVDQLHPERQRGQPDTQQPTHGYTLARVRVLVAKFLARAMFGNVRFCLGVPYASPCCQLRTAGRVQEVFL